MPKNDQKQGSAKNDASPKAPEHLADEEIDQAAGGLFTYSNIGKYSLDSTSLKLDSSNFSTKLNAAPDEEIMP